MLFSTSGEHNVGDFLLGFTERRRDSTDFSEVERTLPAVETQRSSPKTTVSTFASRYEIEFDSVERRGEFVYRAFDLKELRVVFVTIIPKSRFADPGAAQEYLARGRQCVTMTHSAMTKVIDAGELQDCCYVVFEPSEGQSLAQIVSGRREFGHSFGLIEAVQAARSICDAAAFAWHEGLDLDIRSDHIFIGDDRVPRFALRAFLRPRLQTHTDEPSGRDSRRRRKDRVERPALMHRLGHVIHQILVDQGPTVPPSPVSSLRTGVPKRLDKLISKLLAASPSRRPRDFRGVVAEFDAIASELIVRPPADCDESDQIPVAFLPAIVAVAPRQIRRNAWRNIATVAATILFVAASMALVFRVRSPSIASDNAENSRGASTERTRIALPLDHADERPAFPTPGGASALSQLRPATASTSLPTTAEILQEQIVPHALLHEDTLTDVGDNSDPSIERIRLLFGYTREESEPTFPDAPGLLASLSPTHTPDILSTRDDGLLLEPVPPKTTIPIPNTPSAFEVLVFRETSRSETLWFLLPNVTMEDFLAWLAALTAPDLVSEARVVLADAESAMPEPEIGLGRASFREIHDAERKGIEITFPLRVGDFARNKIEVGAYFFAADGSRLKDRDKEYASQRGYVYTKRLISVMSDRLDEPKFKLFLPFVQFDGLPGGTQTLYAQVYVWSGPQYDHRMARGGREKFELTLYKFVKSDE